MVQKLRWCVPVGSRRDDFALLGRRLDDDGFLGFDLVPTPDHRAGEGESRQNQQQY